MSTTTTNLNLTKPANNENVDLSVINGNYDIIDQFAGSVPSTSDIPTATSDLLNDSNFAVDADYVHTDNNYTTTEKTKLAGLNAVTANPSGSATAGNLTKLQVGSDIYAVPSGGGSSGGHVIENSSGTDMAQEDNLQFIGAYLEDDSTNDRTVVNVVREMTASEYNSLSSAEKEGIIHVTDEYDFDALYMVNGVFIDTDNIVASGILNSGSQTYVNWEYTATEDCFVCVSTGKINSMMVQIYVNNKEIINYGTNWTFDSIKQPVLVKKGQTYKITNLGNYSSYIVYGIQTSDDVKSDYHIYSTDEHVVGEWIDGSILYEKTINSDITLSNTFQNYFSTSGIDKIIDVINPIVYRDGEQISMAFSNNGVADWRVQDGYLKVSVQGTITGETWLLKSLTVQYTKSS